MKQFSLLAAIQQNIAGQNYSSEVREVLNAGKEMVRKSNMGFGTSGLLIPIEERDLTVSNGGSPTVQTNVLDLVLPLRNALVAVQAGATFLPNMDLNGTEGSISIPTYAGSSVTWENESDPNSEGSGLLNNILMSPKRLTASLNISAQFLLQTNPRVEAMLRQDLADAIAEKLEAAIFGKAAHAAKQPDGLFTGVTDGLLGVKGVGSLANVLTLESLLENANVKRDKRAYITNGAGSIILKQTPKISGQAIYLQDNNVCNGYPVYVTNNIATGLATAANENGLIFANWSDLIIAQFGVLEIIIDPFSLARIGEVKLIINSFWDVVKRRAASFAIGSIK